MTTAEKRKRIRKELAACGADVFHVAAAALERNEQLQARVAELEALLRR